MRNIVYLLFLYLFLTPSLYAQAESDTPSLKADTTPDISVEESEAAESLPQEPDVEDTEEEPDETAESDLDEGDEETAKNDLSNEDEMDEDFGDEDDTEDEFDDFGDDEFDEFGDEFGDDSQEEVFDPLSGYNRMMTGFNDWFYTWVLDPVARGWRWAVPEVARRGINNFFHNILFPIRFVNNALQLKFMNAGEEAARFGINTTIGILGIWDPAKEWFDLEPHEEDFGQTLGYYGVGGGFHIVLPFFGPSNLRDTFSMYPDDYLNPIYQIDGDDHDEINLEVSNYIFVHYGIRAFDMMNWTSLHIGEYESIKKDAFDLYPFLRDVYEQNRIKEIEE